MHYHGPVWYRSRYQNQNWNLIDYIVVAGMIILYVLIIATFVLAIVAIAL